MLGDLPIHHIPNGVDTDVYRPLDRGHCRSLLGIPVGKRVLLFSAMRMNVSSLDGSRKGGDLLVKALRSLPDSLKAETVLLLLGDGAARRLRRQSASSTQSWIRQQRSAESHRVLCC